MRWADHCQPAHSSRPWDWPIQNRGMNRPHPPAVSSVPPAFCSNVPSSPCGCSRRCEALSPEPQRPWELTSPRSLFFHSFPHTAPMLGQSSTLYQPTRDWFVQVPTHIAALTRHPTLLVLPALAELDHTLEGDGRPDMQSSLLHACCQFASGRPFCQCCVFVAPSHQQLRPLLLRQFLTALRPPLEVVAPRYESQTHLVWWVGHKHSHPAL
mmetsp:Transcript_2640/g.4604  ORF Transcript_2640/g.4604 Transcript_2640/m.4604 type:complete len:211 (-) Transcript_2640:279-911(-)